MTHPTCSRTANQDETMIPPKVIGFTGIEQLIDRLLTAADIPFDSRIFTLAQRGGTRRLHPPRKL